MADAPKQQLPNQRISDPGAAAEVTATDIDAAISQWRKDASPRLRELLDAEVEQRRPDAGI